MGISAADVKSLRDKTGAGMMDCKKALTESGGDFEKAEKVLKEMGLATAAKRSGRATNEGRIFTQVTESRAGILELASETDFVARNEDFFKTGGKMVETLVAKNIQEENDELKEMVKDAISVIKENISIKRFQTLEIGGNELVKDYTHNAGQIGVLVKISADKPEILQAEEVQQFAFDCALHAAAFNPPYLNRDQVEETYTKDQEDLFRKQALELGKPEKVVDGIVKGKLNKHMEQICFVEQPFVKDDKISVKKAADQAAQAAGGGKIELVDFVYYKVGEE